MFPVGLLRKPPDEQNPHYTVSCRLPRSPPDEEIPYLTASRVKKPKENLKNLKNLICIGISFLSPGHPPPGRYPLGAWRLLRRPPDEEIPYLTASRVKKPKENLKNLKNFICIGLSFLSPGHPPPGRYPPGSLEAAQEASGRTDSLPNCLQGQKT